jgi:S-adenosylmethionine:tRNA ribosyltransferase-isomerase
MTAGAPLALTDYDFDLPDGLIARTPLAERDASRLLVLDRQSGAIAHRRFRDWPDLLRSGDLVILNDARVIPARLLGRKRDSGGRVEVLLVRPDAEGAASESLHAQAEALPWICLGQASKGLRPGTVIEFGGGASATVVDALGEGEFRICFAGAESLSALLERSGLVPLPPYVEREPTEEDRLRYQTVYARVEGSVAAPTAGLHLTRETLEELERRGIERAFVTLDVGPGTFLPVRGDDESAHRMHPERYLVPPGTAAAFARARSEGRRIVAVGTTVVRTLESAIGPDGSVAAGPGSTTLFIRPGYRFRAVDALLTNFHLPRSTLLMLVSAFAGREAILAAYRAAVAERYRFFSYGDAMFISSGAAG